MGRSQDWKNVPGITSTDVENLNSIGYSGRLNGVKTSFSSYLNELQNGIEYTVNQTDFDHGDFSEQYQVICVRKESDERIYSREEVYNLLIDLWAADLNKRQEIEDWIQQKL